MSEKKLITLKTLLEDAGLKLDHQFTAKDALAVAGITYRQLNEWDKKGALGASRSTEGGWRRFSFQQLFALLICAEMRRIFGVSLQSLQWLASLLLQPEREDFNWAAWTIADSGWTVYLLTDFRDTYEIHGDIAFTWKIEEGLLRSDSNTGFAFLQINPLINRILVAAGQSPLKKTDEFYRFWKESNSSTYKFPTEEITENERTLLQLVRSKPNQQVTVRVTDGQIETAYVDEDLKIPDGGFTGEQMLAKFESIDYGTFSVGKRAGRYTHMNLRTPIKVDRDTGRTHSLSAGEDE